MYIDDVYEKNVYLRVEKLKKNVYDDYARILDCIWWSRIIFHGYIFSYIDEYVIISGYFGKSQIYTIIITTIYKYELYLQLHM